MKKDPLFSRPAAGPRPVRTGAAYFGNRFRSHARRDSDVLKGCCDHVVHTVSETDLYHHKAALRRIFEETRRRGMEVWADPWGLGGVFGGEALSKFLLDHPEDWQVFSDGRRVPAACLNRERFRNFVKEWVLNVKEMGAQVIFWDEPHLFFHWNLERRGEHACLCPACQELCQKTLGGPLPPRLTDRARDFRRRTLRSFLDEMTAFARENGLRNALCLYAFEGYGDYDRLWEELSSLPALDIFGCDPYWRWLPVRWPALFSAKIRKLNTAAAYVGHFSRRVVERAAPAGKAGQIWIQAMRLPKGKEGEILPACRAAVQAGVAYVTAWSYDGGALLDPVLSEDPALVWEWVARSFAEIKRSR